jgi:hypothetical protein
VDVWSKHADHEHGDDNIGSHQHVNILLKSTVLVWSNDCPFSTPLYGQVWYLTIMMLRLDMMLACNLMQETLHPLRENNMTRAWHLIGISMAFVWHLLGISLANCFWMLYSGCQRPGAAPATAPQSAPGAGWRPAGDVTLRWMSQ